MKNIAVFFAFIFLFFQASCLFASYDTFLDTCLRIAESRDKKLAVAAEQINLSKIRVLRAARNRWPMVAAQRKFTRGRTVLMDTTAGTQDYQQESYGLRAGLPIYQGGRISSSHKYDKLMRESAQFNYTKIREDLFYNVKLAYYEYQTLRMEYTALKKAFGEIEALGRKVRIEYNAKSISELDLIEAEHFKNKLSNLFLTSQASLELATKKLAALVRVQSVDEIPAALPDGLTENVPEITFTLDECLSFIPLNSVDLRLNQLQIMMSAERIIISRSKIIPKLDLEGFYGKSGEAYITQPLDLTTSWSVLGRFSWTLWGNTFEATSSQDKMNPNELVDPNALTDNNTLEMKLGIIDDLSYFVDSKESKVSIQQAESEYNDTMLKLSLSLQKAHNEYSSSLRSQRTLKDEMRLAERKLLLMRKRNELLEVPTVQLMEETWKYAETISNYGKALYSNYASVTEMERLVLISLR